jgi:hypothetical protein
MIDNQSNHSLMQETNVQPKKKGNILIKGSRCAIGVRLWQDSDAGNANELTRTIFLNTATIAVLTPTRVALQIDRDSPSDTHMLRRLYNITPLVLELDVSLTGASIDARVCSSLQNCSTFRAKKPTSFTSSPIHLSIHRASSLVGEGGTNIVFYLVQYKPRASRCAHSHAYGERKEGKIKVFI